MKRILVFVLALLLVCTSAFASTPRGTIEARPDARQEQESPSAGNDVCFPGIPWGLNVSETLSRFSAAGFETNPEDVTNEYDLQVWTCDFREEYLYDVPNAGYIQNNFYADDSEPEFLGCPVNHLALMWHYDCQGSSVDLEKEHARFYMAKLALAVKPEAVPSTYEDLKAQLTALYGAPQETVSHQIDTTYTYSIWTGSSDTAVCLWLSQADAKANRRLLRLWYGKTNSSQTLASIRDLTDNSEPASIFR